MWEVGIRNTHKYGQSRTCPNHMTNTKYQVPTVNKYGQLTGPVQTRGPSPRAGRASKWGKSLGHVRNQGPRCTWSVLQGVRDVVKEFFGLSYVSVDNMGYGRNFVKSEDQPLDWIDRVTMKAAPAGATQGLHVWPQRPAIFRLDFALGLTPHSDARALTLLMQFDRGTAGGVPSVERHEMGQCDLATRGIAGECGRFDRDHERWEVEEPMA
ncbi:hypothetical protein GBA52_027524 [Prunus armeniaca]|nr:hypothetical protein GBA52_027524 [Prunus armeniaca]